MPREIHPDLVARLRRADPTARQIVEAQVVEYTAAGAPMEHVRSTKEGPADTRWSEADSLTGLTVFDNGDVRITGTITSLASHASGTDEQTDLDRTTPVKVALIELADAMDAEQEISRISVRLNPRRSASQPREVVTWRMELYRLVDGRENGIQAFFAVAPIETPLDVLVTGDSESDVEFDYRSASRQPRPKEWPGVKKHGTYISDYFTSPTAGVIRVGRHYLLVAVYALNADGDAAGNVSWDYDAASASVTSGGHTLRGRSFIVEADGSWRDDGSLGGTPRILIEAGSFSSQVIEFIANPFDVGATPAGDLELVGHGATPRGTSITYEVRNDADSAWVAFEDGDLHSDVGIGKTMPRKMRATLTTNGGGTLSPILKKLGLRAITRVDVSRVCEVREYEEAFDPETMKVEMNRFGSLGAIRNGPPGDFHSAVEDLLAQHFARHLLFRAYIGDSALPRAKWLHKTDFLVGDWEGNEAGLVLRGQSILAHLKDLVPPYSPGTNHAPDGDQSVGSWTTAAGGGTNLYQQIDEETVDETDYIRSGTSPSNQQVVHTLPTPSDFADRRLFVDCEYGKDQAGGEQIDLRIQLYQVATLIAEVVNTDIGPDRQNATMELTERQRQLITDPANLRLAFSANAPSPGTGRRALVYWARFRTGGRREVVTYENETLKAACDDLVDNRLALESRYRGPLIESTAYTVSKQLTGIRGRNPDGKDIVGKAELEALGKLAGGIIHEKQGRIVFTDVFGAKPVAAEFPASRIELGAVGPGLERRVPEFFVPYRWDPTVGEFEDEARAVHENSLLRIGRVGLGAPKWETEEVAQWIDSDALAEALAVRTVEAFGTGMMLWSFTSIDAYPELHIGDLVSVETTKFVNRDPNTAREVRGRLWVTGVITRADFWGKRFTIWVRNVVDIKVPTLADPPIGGTRKKAFYVRGRGLGGDDAYAFSATLADAIAAPSNLALNWDAEQGRNYWRRDNIQGTGALLDLETSAPQSGVNSFKAVLAQTTPIKIWRFWQVDRATDDNADGGKDLLIPAVAGDTIDISAFWKTSVTAGSQRILFGIREYDGAKNSLGDTTIQNETPAASSAWRVTEGKLGITNPSTRYVQLWVEVEGATGADTTWYWDELLLHIARQSLVCRVARSTDQTIVTNTLTALSWDTEIFDPFGMHDSGTNPSRISIPSWWRGMGRVRLRAQVRFSASANGYRRIAIRHGGATEIAEMVVDPVQTASIPTTLCCEAQHGSVGAGDYWEVLVRHTHGADLPVDQGGDTLAHFATFFELEMIPAGGP